MGAKIKLKKRRKLGRRRAAIWEGALAGGGKNPAERSTPGGGFEGKLQESTAFRRERTSSLMKAEHRRPK